MKALNCLAWFRPCCFPAVLLGFATTAVAQSNLTKPNIIVIYTDDQGYGDVSALNPDAKVQTPHMDRLAKEGIVFTNGHSADSICTPSRYGLLTGRYAKVPPTLYTSQKKNPRSSDYRIMPPYDPKKGMEVAEDFIDNQCLTRFTNKAIEWMSGKVADAKAGKPFFLYLPYTSPHFPICPLPEFQGQGESGAYGEFLVETDFHIGRILEFLQRNGLDDQTLIVFTSDNGPEKVWDARIKEYHHDSRGGLREGKRSVYEGGHRVPFLVRWPAGIKKPNDLHWMTKQDYDQLAN